MQTSVLTTQFCTTVNCWGAKTAYRPSVYMMGQKRSWLESCYTVSGNLSQRCGTDFSGEQPGLNDQMDDQPSCQSLRQLPSTHHWEYAVQQLSEHTDWFQCLQLNTARTHIYSIWSVWTLTKKMETLKENQLLKRASLRTKKNNQSVKMELFIFGLVSVFFCFFFLRSLNTGELKNMLSVNLSPRLILLSQKKKERKKYNSYSLLFWQN